MHFLKLLLVATVSLAATAQTARRTRNVVIVMSDGLRWQEVFRGADEALLTADNTSLGRPLDQLRRDYQRGDAEDSRMALMPFFWNVVAQQGQVFGDEDAGSRVLVRNGFNRSYPGYNETLTGRPNPLIQTNDDIPNPRPTVLEWLNTQKEFHGRVAAFASWVRLSTVLRADRCGFPVHVAMQPYGFGRPDAEDLVLDRIRQNLPRPFGDDEALDAPEFEAALDYLRTKHPRVLYLQLIETDAWAHHGQYGLYLDAIHHADQFLHTLWDALQSMPQYRNSTTLVFTTDHGRGSGAEWVTHGEHYAGADRIFDAYLGGSVPPLGVRTQAPDLSQGQLAATVANLLGKDFAATNAEITPPIHFQPQSSGR